MDRKQAAGLRVSTHEGAPYSNPARSSGLVGTLMSWTRGGVACQIPREKTAQLCPTGGPSGSATLVLGAGRRKGTLIPVLGWWKAVAGEAEGAASS